jgi:hypothetical protein
VGTQNALLNQTIQLCFRTFVANKKEFGQKNAAISVFFAELWKRFAPLWKTPQTLCLFIVEPTKS